MSWYTPSHRDSQAIVFPDPPEGFYIVYIFLTSFETPAE